MKQSGKTSADSQNPIVLVTGSDNDRKALEIDGLIGQQEIVIKSHHDGVTAGEGVEFPYRGDPVLAVQSLFFIAESAIAAGDETRARENYSAFLGYWGDALWDLAAVKRAQAKLTSLEKTGLPQDDPPPSDQ